MNVLLLGSGGREHALAWKLSQSPALTKLYVAPGNAGTSQIAINTPIGVNEFELIGKFSVQEQIDMIVVGPEDPLVNGISDYFASNAEFHHIPVIGPAKAGARLEGSKDFAKEFMFRNQIPTAAYKSFNLEQEEDAREFIKTLEAPYVLKADGLAAGKGVVIADDQDVAFEALHEMFSGKFGSAGNKVVIEEFLSGIEVSVFVLTDGKNYLILPEAKDYKRIGEGDTGPNTGGMGAISPVPFADDAFMKKVEDRIIRPTIEGLQKENIPYKGFIFFGLIKVNDEPMVIEYNVRMGDPETEAVMLRIENDILELFSSIANGTLDQMKMEISPRTAATVMLVSGGYPGDYTKGEIIEGLSQPTGDSVIFHAGTSTRNKTVVTSGGRVIAVSSLAGTMDEALDMSNRIAGNIQFEGKYFRHDIGFDLR